MTEINKAGEVQSLGHIDIPQGKFREQLDAVTDAVRQLGGNPKIAPGAGTVNDPLNAPYVLYVNSYTGSDRFVTGDYAAADDGSFEQKMRRISNQRLECGYTESRPFRTINRAIIEAGIITSRDYLDLTPAPCGDLVSIVVAAGAHTALNEAPTDAVTEWADGCDPTDEELRGFNASDVGGVILPRGVSLISLDLRKTIIRPEAVPTPADEEADYSNRRAIFRLTGGCYVYGMTFMDKVGFDQSHHLLDVFQYASKSQLDKFYENIRTAFGNVADINSSYAVSRSNEYQIVGPQPEVPKESTDTVGSASPYLYNISIRSTYGLCGIFADGSAVEGFRSIVIAQYTGVSLQKDMDCWQRYRSGDWEAITYDQYINSDPNDLRANPDRRSFHVRAVNRAVIQEVSVFAIGQAIHHWVESGGELTVTNSNSNWGGCAALAEGFHDKAAPTDKFHNFKFIERPLDPVSSGSVEIIRIGELTEGHADDCDILTFKGSIDRAFEEAGYNLNENDYIWVVNGLGPDYRAKIDKEDTLNGDEIIRLKDDIVAPGNKAPGSDKFKYAKLENSEVYIRRLIDDRPASKRAYAILVESDTNTRPPLRDYIPQIDGSDWTERISTVLATASITNNSKVNARVQFRYSNRPAAETEFSNSKYYRPADVVRRRNKHYTAVATHYGPWDDDNWDESFVHMDSDYDAEGFYKNAAPEIIMDGDKSDDEDSTDLGLDSSSDIIKVQVESAVDYLGLYQLLRNLGKTDAQAKTLLTPVEDEKDREESVVSEKWELEFRRPSNIRLFGHAFEWAGYANYTKAVPKYQQLISQNNKFNYFFTHEDGGRVYCSGFNEEGFLVTNSGIQDLATGESVELDGIGAPDISLQKQETPCATKSASGVVNIASTKDIENALTFKNPEEPGKGSNYVKDADECPNVLDVADLYRVKQDIILSSEEELKILPDEYSVIFIHADVKREMKLVSGVWQIDETADASDLPNSVLEANNAVGRNGTGEEAAAVVSFRTLWQAFEWIDGRAPIGEEEMLVYVLGKQDADPANKDENDPVRITAAKKTIIQGYNGSRTGNACYLAGHIEHGANSTYLEVRNCTLSVGGSVANEESPFVPTQYGINSAGEKMRFRNCRIRNRSTTESTFIISQIQAPETALCELLYADASATEIHFDGICNGKKTTDYGRVALDFKKLRIRSGALQTNKSKNTLLWKMAHTNNDKSLRVRFESIDFRVSSFDGDDDRQNGKLEWEFDFTGHAGEDYVGLGPLQASRMDVRRASDTEFTASVKSVGSLKNVELFGCRTSAYPASYMSMDDLNKSTRSNAAPDSSGNMDDTKYRENTVTGTITKAFEDKGIDMDNTTNVGFRAQETCIYNGVFFSNFGPVEYPGNTTRALTYDFDDSLEDLEGLD